jgi:hypothetical protein
VRGITSEKSRERAGDKAKQELKKSVSNLRQKLCGCGTFLRIEVGLSAKRRLPLGQVVTYEIPNRAGDAHTVRFRAVARRTRSIHPIRKKPTSDSSRESSSNFDEQALRGLAIGEIASVSKP